MQFFNKFRFVVTPLQSLIICYRNDIHCYWCPLLVPANILLTSFIFGNVISTSYLLSCVISLHTLLVHLILLVQFKWQSLAVPMLSVIIAVFSKYFFASESFWILSLTLLCNGIVLLWTLRNLPFLFPKSFSYCELHIVCEGGSAFASQSFGCLLSKIFHLRNGCLCSDHIPTLILQCMFLGLTLLLITFRYCDKMRKTIVGCYSLILLMNLFIYVFIWNCIEVEPLTWLLQYLLSTKERVYLFIVWLTCVTVCVTFAVTTKKASTSQRKFFHIVFDIIFILGLKNDIELLYFSSASILYVLLVAEILRVLNVPPLAKYIQQSFVIFRDEKDIGMLTLTHVYLLVGVCVPLWIYPNFENEKSLLTASGLIATGFGDTAASFFGSKFGKHKWPSSNKSYEGSFAALVSQIIGSLFILYFLSLDVSMDRIILLSIASLFTAVVEALTQQIDNLLIPFYFNVFLLFSELIKRF